METADKEPQLNIRGYLNKELQANHYYVFLGVGIFHTFKFDY